MTFGQSISHVFSNYATFTGRAPRSEFWWFALFTLVASIALSFLDGLIFGAGGIGILSTLFSLAILIPSVAVGVRRLHDIDRTGWWYLLVLVPILGFLVLLFFFVQRGTAGPNRFGPDPLGAAA